MRNAAQLFFIFGTGDLWNQLLPTIVAAPTDELNAFYKLVYKPVSITFIITFEVRS